MAADEKGKPSTPLFAAAANKDSSRTLVAAQTNPLTGWLSNSSFKPELVDAPMALNMSTALADDASESWSSDSSESKIVGESKQTGVKRKRGVEDSRGNRKGQSKSKEKRDKGKSRRKRSKSLKKDKARRKDNRKSQKSKRSTKRHRRHDSGSDDSSLEELVEDDDGSGARQMTDREKIMIIEQKLKRLTETQRTQTVQWAATDRVVDQSSRAADVHERHTTVSEPHSSTSRQKQAHTRESEDDAASDASSHMAHQDVSALYEIDTLGDTNNAVFQSLHKDDVARYRRLDGGGHVVGTREGLPAKLLRELLLVRGPGEPVDLSLARDMVSFRKHDRYFSDKHILRERDKSLKRIRTGSRVRHGDSVESDYVKAQRDFIPLPVRGDVGDTKEPTPAEAEEKVDEEGKTQEEYVVLRNADFNSRTTQNPSDARVWLEFAAFQDESATLLAGSSQLMSSAVLQKKIAILEKGLRFCPHSEELMLAYLRSCAQHFPPDDMAKLWERFMTDNPTSPRLWKDYISFKQSQFSTFSVADIRKAFADALARLSETRQQLMTRVYESKQTLQAQEHARVTHPGGGAGDVHPDRLRQMHQGGALSPEASRTYSLGADEVASITEAIKSIDQVMFSIFLRAAGFEYQSGYTQRCIGLFQALIEFNVFRPRVPAQELDLSTKAAQLYHFQAFWESEAPRVGDISTDGETGWWAWYSRLQRDGWQRVLSSAPPQAGLSGSVCAPVEQDDYDDALSRWLVMEQQTRFLRFQPVRGLSSAGVLAAAETARSHGAEAKDHAADTSGSEEEDDEAAPNDDDQAAEDAMHNALHSVVLWEDIKHFVFEILNPVLQERLIRALLRLLGLGESLLGSRLALDGDSVDMIMCSSEAARGHDRALETEWFEDVAGLTSYGAEYEELASRDSEDALHGASSIRTESNADADSEESAGVTSGFLHLRHQLHPASLQRAFPFPPYPLGESASSGSQASMAPPRPLNEPNHVAFARRILQQTIPVMPWSTVLKCCSVAVENWHSYEAGRTTAKAFLTKDQLNIPLWYTYAQLEESRRKFKAARKVYSSALSLGPKLPTDQQFYLPFLHWAWGTMECTRCATEAGVDLKDRYSLKDVGGVNTVNTMLHIAIMAAPGMPIAPLPAGPTPPPPPTLVARAVLAYKMALLDRDKLTWGLAPMERPSAAASSPSVPASPRACTVVAYAWLQYYSKLSLDCIFEIFEEHVFPYVDRRADVRRSAGASAAVSAADVQWTSVAQRACHGFPRGGTQHLWLMEEFIKLVQSHRTRAKVPPRVMRKALKTVLDEFPSHPLFLRLYVELESSGHLVAGMRRHFDMALEAPAATSADAGRLVHPYVWLFALVSEFGTHGSPHRVMRLFERALSTEARSMVALWRLLMFFHLNRGDTTAARQIFYRAVHACPWSKTLWMTGLSWLHQFRELSAQEACALTDLLRDKDIRLHSSAPRLQK